MAHLHRSSQDTNSKGERRIPPGVIERSTPKSTEPAPRITISGWDCFGPTQRELLTESPRNLDKKMETAPFWTRESAPKKTVGFYGVV